MRFLKNIFLSVVLVLVLVTSAFGAITFTYDESDNKVVQTEGTSGTPATFADFVTFDRAGTAELTPEDTPTACTTNITLTYQIRPVEDLALQITFTLAGTSAGAGDTLDVTGTDWDGQAQGPESIDVSGGDGAYTGANKWRTITDIDCTGWADGTLKVTQPQWGVIWDYGNGKYHLDCNFTVGNGTTSTYFTNTYVSWSIGSQANQLGFSVLAEAVFTQGSKQSGAESYGRGGEITTWKSLYDLMTGTINLYGVNWRHTNGYWAFNGVLDFHYVWFEGAVPFFQPSSSGTVSHIRLIGRRLFVYTNDITFSDVYIGNTSDASISWSTPAANATITDLNFDVNSGVDIDLSKSTSWILHLINPQVIPTLFAWTSAGTNTETLRMSFLADINVSDKDGTALQNAIVDCQDVDGNYVWAQGSVLTDASGDIAQQTIRYQIVYWDGAEQIKTYSPHKFTFSKAGYETQIYDAITVDAPIDWHVEMQPIRHPPSPWFGMLAVMIMVGAVVTYRNRRFFH